MKFLSIISVYNDVRNFRVKKAFKKTSIDIIKTIWMFNSLTIEFLNEANNYSDDFDKKYDATNRCLNYMASIWIWFWRRKLLIKNCRKLFQVYWKLDKGQFKTKVKGAVYAQRYINLNCPRQHHLNRAITVSKCNFLVHHVALAFHEATALKNF